VKKALIFNPYLDTLGGGEYFCFKVAQFLVDNNYEVEIAWPQSDILKNFNQRFNLYLNNQIKFNPHAWQVLQNKQNLLQKYLFTKKYQFIFFVSDGSLPFLFGKKNILLFQAPFVGVGGRSFLNQLKLKNTDATVCYSNYVKKFIDKEYKINALVIYPPIAEEFFQETSQKKSNIILSVGRFDQIMNAKRQDVLVNVFKLMVDNGLKNWQLVLIGGLMQAGDYFKDLKKSGEGYPIKILTNASFDTLLHYCQRAKIYWHAAGYGTDLTLEPEKAEHFGISIVEAMASRTVPIVFKGGGPAEIVGNNNEMLCWTTPSELQEKTKLLITNNSLWSKLSEKVSLRAKSFELTSFSASLSKLL
jgi:glycosyltransferase involved in cell wall biosynthesis